MPLRFSISNEPAMIPWVQFLSSPAGSAA
jgi:hypothetical protein